MALPLYYFASQKRSSDQGKKIQEKAATYYVTDRFKHEFQFCNTETNVKNYDHINTEISDSSSTDSLKSKLNQYQVDMIACAGECREYQQLAVDFPYLREKIEPMYHKARERSSELMGQLRAINNLIHTMDLSE